MLQCCRSNLLNRLLAMSATLIPRHLARVRVADFSSSQLLHLGHVFKAPDGFQRLKLCLANHNHLHGKIIRIYPVTHATSKHITRRTRTSARVIQRLFRPHDEAVFGRHEQHALIRVIQRPIVALDILHGRRPIENITIAANRILIRIGVIESVVKRSASRARARALARSATLQRLRLRLHRRLSTARRRGIMHRHRAHRAPRLTRARARARVRRRPDAP
mmetsp:Transcript_8405/g.31248  ORF Transcript_8405/g.31248 Transcript_8405/m.31248 type:complete len:220 (-) Transcript_8405:189-848(-)